jgi:hypothetical protein
MTKRPDRVYSSAFFIASLCWASLFLSGCAITQKATVEADGSGSARLRIELESFYHEALLDMASLEEGSSFEAGGSIFDLEGTREAFDRKESVQLVDIDSPDPRVLEASVVFRDVEEVFKSQTELTAAGVISFDSQGPTKTITLHIDRQNFVEISEFFALKNNPLFETFGPEQNEHTTQEEYMEMVEFMLGEEGPPSLLESFIELEVNVKGKILSQKGGRVAGNSVFFRIPLIRVLLLNQPLDYSIVFR